MKKIVSSLLVVVAVAIMTSCTVVVPGMVTTASIVKTGEAKANVWFGIARNVDVSVATAAKNGGITKVATVDYGIKAGLFKTTYFVRVSGE